MSQIVTPLDPDSAKGREVARRLTGTLAEIRIAIEERRRRAAEPDTAERAA